MRDSTQVDLEQSIQECLRQAHDLNLDSVNVITSNARKLREVVQTYHALEVSTYNVVYEGIYLACTMIAFFHPLETKFVYIDNEKYIPLIKEIIIKAFLSEEVSIYLR